MQDPAFRNQTIGASRRQPFEAAHIARCQPNAVPHLGLTMRIVATAATLAIEQFATTSVNTVASVSSSISLFRQHRPQPSHKLSHSARVISDIALRRQNGACGSDIKGIFRRGPFVPVSGHSVTASCRRLISATFHGISSFTLVPAGRNRGIGRGLADRLKLFAPASGRHPFQEQHVLRDLFPEHWKRSIKRFLLALDAWIDFSLFRSASGARESYERFSTSWTASTSQDGVVGSMNCFRKALR